MKTIQDVKAELQILVMLADQLEKEAPADLDLDYVHEELWGVHQILRNKLQSGRVGFW